MIRSLSVLAAIAFAATPLAAQTAPAADKPVAVLVSITIPPGIPRAAIADGMAKAVPQYRAVPGLVRKLFTIGDDGGFGGIYLFRTRGAAQAWFNDAWYARVAKTYGSPGKVSYYDVPVALDNAPLPDSIAAK
jgi:hypothetical protein